MVQGIPKMVAQNHIQETITVQVPYLRPAGPHQVPGPGIGRILWIKKLIIKPAECTIPLIDIHYIGMGKKEIWPCIVVDIAYKTSQSIHIFRKSGFKRNILKNHVSHVTHQVGFSNRPSPAIIVLHQQI